MSLQLSKKENENMERLLDSPLILIIFLLQASMWLWYEENNDRLLCFLTTFPNLS